MSVNRIIDDAERSDPALGNESLPVAALPGGALAQPLDAETIAKIRRVLTDGTPVNTRRAYQADLRYFEAWRAISRFGIGWPVEPEVMVRFIAEMVEGMPPDTEDYLVKSGVKKGSGLNAWSTVERRIAAIATAHRTKGLASPTAHPVVVEIMGRARRASISRGWAPTRKAAALRDVLERMLATCAGDGMVEVRDRALLLFGFSSGGRRRSEIAEAVVERLQKIGNDYVYRMGRTKTEQAGGDRPVPVAGRAAKAMDAWLSAAGIDQGPLFRAVTDKGTVSPEPISDRTIARIVKRRIALIGLDPDGFSGHSLRSGFLTEAGKRGHSLLDAMGMSGHKDMQTAAIYYRIGEVLRLGAGRLMDDGEPEAAAAPPAAPPDAAAEGPSAEEAMPDFGDGAEDFVLDALDGDEEDDLDDADVVSGEVPDAAEEMPEDEGGHEAEVGIVVAAPAQPEEEGTVGEDGEFRPGFLGKPRVPELEPVALSRPSYPDAPAVLVVSPKPTGRVLLDDMQERHLPHVVALAEREFGTGYLTVEDLSAPGTRVLTASIDGVFAGFVSCLTSTLADLLAGHDVDDLVASLPGGEVGVIKTVAVVPERRRCGLGRKLLAFAETGLEDDGMSNIAVPVWVRPGGSGVATILQDMGYYMLLGDVRIWKRRCGAGEFACAERSGDACCCSCEYWVKRI